jgi:hypothetical protein
LTVIFVGVVGQSETIAIGSADGFQRFTYGLFHL